jgi:ubiquinone/menaquinone biosynthesis C-methylase UbiE
MNQNDKISQDQIRQVVRQGYAEIAAKKKCCCGPEASAEQLAKGIGYLEDDLADIPEGSNMGLSCGNPTAIANLKSGQVVLDLGSGGGFDVFIAAKKVGASGKAIGVDMTPEMLSKSRQAIAVFTKKTGLENVEFRLGEIEHLPVADNSVDVVISNCVINLSPDKPQVWREIHRVLKPGGKACVSDLALTLELPDKVRKSVSALVGCVAGAVLLDETKKIIESVGLSDLHISTKKYYVDIMENCSDSFYKEVNENLPPGKKLSDYIVSVNITAFKS